MSLSFDPQHHKSQQPQHTAPRNTRTHSAPSHVHTNNPYHTLPSNSSLFMPNAYPLHPTLSSSMYHPTAVPLNTPSNMSPLPPIITNFPNHLSSFPPSSMQRVSSYPNIIHHHRNMSPQQVLPLINAATLHTMQRTDDLALNNQLINLQSAPQVLATTPLTSSPVASTVTMNEDKDVDDHEMEGIKTHNPWFNDEVASIVKLHRKTARKYHRSKTNKKELKEICKKLEKKKRKLIKAAKQKYMQQIMAQKTVEKIENAQDTSDVQRCREKESDTQVAMEHEGDNDKNMSGYLLVYMIQMICEIVWRHWADGTHWKVDVDDILESNDNNEKSTYLYNWWRQWKSGNHWSKVSGWRQWKSGNHWKVAVAEILSSSY